ncbi:hypothetical protein GOP47_0031010 [Adiantum capillus-veneris]|nr:hypothetical protein GOP47_0031010 [Adiantum capillus-veneris]
MRVHSGGGGCSGAIGAIAQPAIRKATARVTVNKGPLEILFENCSLKGKASIRASFQLEFEPVRTCAPTIRLELEPQNP